MAVTVAEAQSVRKAWTEVCESMDKVVEKFDENPEDDKEAVLLIVFSGLMCSGFMTKAIAAANRLKELNSDVV